MGEILPTCVQARESDNSRFWTLFSLMSGINGILLASLSIGGPGGWRLFLGIAGLAICLVWYLIQCRMTNWCDMWDATLDEVEFALRKKNDPEVLADVKVWEDRKAGQTIDCPPEKLSEFTGVPSSWDNAKLAQLTALRFTLTQKNSRRWSIRSTAWFRRRTIWLKPHHFTVTMDKDGRVSWHDCTDRYPGTSTRVAGRRLPILFFLAWLVVISLQLWQAKMPNTAAVALHIQTLEDKGRPDAVRIYAAETLAELGAGHQYVADALNKLLKDNGTSPDLRAAASWALGRLGAGPP